METSLQAARRLFELAEKKPDLQLAGRLLRPDTSALAVRGLTFRYEPHLPPVLVDFDLELPPGKRVALVGDSGAGKTTLLRLLARFWDAPAGSIWLAGEDILAYDPDDIRQLLGMAEQKPYLFTATLRQNLRLARPDAEEDDLHHVLAAAGLAGWLASLPNGLDTWLGENGAAMSGGERQRLAVARALLRDAPVLLLDEPAAHLDGLNETRLMRQLNEVTRGRSLILVTHRLRQLEWLDEILVLRAGRVVERGTHAELLVAGGVYAEMRRLQSATLAEVGELS